MIAPAGEIEAGNQLQMRQTHKTSTDGGPRRSLPRGQRSRPGGRGERPATRFRSEAGTSHLVRGDPKMDFACACGNRGNLRVPLAACKFLFFWLLRTPSAEVGKSFGRFTSDFA